MDEVVLRLDSVFERVFFNTFLHNQQLSSISQQYLVEGSIIRQILCLYFILIVGGTLLYFICSSISYFLFFVLWKDFYHNGPQPFPGQVKKEIQMALWSIPNMAHLTVPFFLGQIRGYSKLYASVSKNGGWSYVVMSFVMFLIWSDSLIYWIHRELHDIKWAYKNIHKLHHLWKAPTPYAAIAFHPIDGWLQSVPYHLFPYICPMQKWLSLCCFVFVQIWAVLIHDGVHLTPLSFVNGAAHHTFHHSKFVFNYGQFFVFWDKACGTHMDPMATFDCKAKTWKLSDCVN